MKKIKKQGSNICFLIIVILLALVPIMYQYELIEASSTVLFIGKCMAFAIVAIGLDLIWGYTGILSLGHGLYFALGGYAMAMYLKLQRTGGGITDFMHIGGLKELPLVWKPFLSLPVSIFLILFVPGILAGVIGYFIFKNRVKGVYFSIISQALTWAAYSIFIALSPYTNGNVGITDIQSVFGSIKGSMNFGNLQILFYSALILLILVYAGAKFLTGRKFGKLLIAIRDGENRTYFSGYQVSRYKTFIYVLSAILAGIAGAIFVNFNGSITPNQMTIAYSITMVIWVAVGGRGTIIGAVIGAFLINMCEYKLSSGGLVEVWQYLIGAIFCITIIFFKGGIIGIVRDHLFASGRRKKAERRELRQNS
ncbi:urea ABC transporter permease subunit UrtC [Anaerostipes sp. MSJ-23]|uniref:urea ABC transporter permease subunit UrtC n=2 Tax=unclassified Anaerostipes TaxID=2635253 RepID=UPI0020A22EE9|nr:urea ABC transporter permease subunit UrtC [Anaerostipes sp. MSJ-23]